MRNLTVGLVQCALEGQRADNVDRVLRLAHQAVEQGAQVILLPELFEGPYFPRTEEEQFFSWAQELENNPTVERLQAFAQKHSVHLPYSFFERSGPAFYNSLTLVTAQGELQGLYRKSHIPDGPGYEEKFYFRGGDTGFQVFDIGLTKLGIGICWDQWFPECARAMALKGAEILLYPTAIGSEPSTMEATDGPWRTAMLGHAVANAMPVVAANRIGIEGEQAFYGKSFIASPRGEVVASLEDEEGVLVHAFELDALAERRAEWGFFRDRRPDLYEVLLTADGKVRFGT